MIIDYYRDSVEKKLDRNCTRGVIDERPGRLYVLSSHSHADHFNPEVLTWRQERPDVQFIFSKDILENQLAEPDDACYFDREEYGQMGYWKYEAFGSTDLGISFLLHLDGKLIFHAGDLNNWHWKEESTGEEVREAENAYFSELDVISRHVGRIDLVMFPVDPRLGKDYMLGAKQFVDRFQVGTFVPMHFDNAYDKANAFQEYAESRGICFVKLNHKHFILHLNFNSKIYKKWK